MTEHEQPFPLRGPVLDAGGHLWHFTPRVGARRLAEVQDGAEGGTNLQAVEVVQAFIAETLDPADREAWAALVAGDALANYELMDLYVELVKAYANRPTPAPSPSSTSGSGNGTASMVPSPSPAGMTSGPASGPTFGVS